jgi:hypothetical protein
MILTMLHRLGFSLVVEDQPGTHTEELLDLCLTVCLVPMWVSRLTSRRTNVKVDLNFCSVKTEIDFVASVLSPGSLS